MRKLMLGLAAVCCAFLIGFGVTHTAMAHGKHIFISPGTVAIYTTHFHNDAIDTACQGNYDLDFRHRFNSVGSDELEFRDTRMTPDIHWGSASSGLYRLGTYQNQSEYQDSFTLGEGLIDGEDYDTSTFNADLEFSQDNQVVVTVYSAAGNVYSWSNICNHVDYDYIYPND